jgi:hypothetical protein
MATTYDTIWTTFLNKCKLQDIDLPQEQDKIYDSIHGAILSFNNRLPESIITYFDVSEMVDHDLSDNDLLVLAHYIRLDILSNQLTYFTTVWQPFEGDIGLKNYTSQLVTLRTIVENEENTIERLIANSTEDYL